MSFPVGDRLVLGEWFAVRYHRGNSAYVMRAQYLGKNYAGDHEFSLRPLFGTVSFHGSQLVSVHRSEEPSPLAPRKV